jgi:hypothetical protein
MKIPCRIPKSGPSGSENEASYNSDDDDFKNEDIKIEIDNDSWKNHLNELGTTAVQIGRASGGGE